jgi:hypothetical protein
VSRPARRSFRSDAEDPPDPYDEDRELDDCGDEEPREELPYDGPMPCDGPTFEY